MPPLTIRAGGSPEFTPACVPCRQHGRMLDQCTIHCPWCGERFQALADASEGDAEYIEDCPVCCHPVTMRQRVDETGRPSLMPDRAD